MLRIGVIGGGMQGAGIAIELALRGCSVEILEREQGCLTRASAQNEGKIHLGFVYANDATLATARLCARTAVRFAPIVSRWLESDLPAVSRPFHYLVHRNSLLRAEQLARTYQAITGLLREAVPSGCYFGQPISEEVVRLCGSAFDAMANPETVEAVYRTPEIAVDPERIASLLRSRLHHDPNIAVRTARRVSAIRQTKDYVEVGWDGPSCGNERYDHVVNASWDSLVALDRAAGIERSEPFSYRFKYFLRFRTAAILPSITIALGPFGDVVGYADGEAFLSWYPVGRIGMVVNDAAPDWSLAQDATRESELREGIVRGLASIVPSVQCLSMSELMRAELSGGVILAAGSTDVDDSTSVLHRRTAVGPRSFGRYHTADPGKYSFAPFFAEMLAKRIAGMGT